MGVADEQQRPTGISFRAGLRLFLDVSRCAVGDPARLWSGTMLMRNPSRRPTCSFCATDKDAVELLFVSDIGGTKPAICSGCIDRFHVVVTEHRRSPEAAAAAVAGYNQLVTKGEREALRLGS